MAYYRVSLKVKGLALVVMMVEADDAKQAVAKAQQKLYDDTGKWSSLRYIDQQDIKAVFVA